VNVNPIKSYHYLHLRILRDQVVCFASALLLEVSALPCGFITTSGTVSNLIKRFEGVGIVVHHGACSSRMVSLPWFSENETDTHHLSPISFSLAQLSSMVAGPFAYQAKLAILSLGCWVGCNKNQVPEDHDV
jgi:hypothetical protein